MEARAWFQYIKISVLLAHKIVTLFRRRWTRIMVVYLSFVIHAIEWVDVLLDSHPCRGLRLVDEDCDADSLKDEKKGEHTDPGEKPQDKGSSLFS